MKFISIRMCITLIVSSVAALITPLLLRTAIDGILMTDDQNALVFALSSIAWIELIGVFCDFSFRKDLNASSQNFIQQTKSTLLKKMADGQAAIKPEELERIFLRDLRTLANAKVKDRWIITKECLTLLLMGTLTFYVSPTAGILLVLLLFVHIGFGYWSMMTSKNKTKTWSELQENEETLIKQWAKQNWLARDGGYSNTLLSQTISRFELIGKEQNATQSFRDQVDSVFRVFRTLSIFGILIITLASAETSGDSAGTLTALMIILFRLSRPMETISKWALQDLRSELASQRVKKWIHHNISTRGEPPNHYNSAKKFLEDTYECTTGNATEHTNEVRTLTANTTDIELFLECARIWRERVSTKCKVLIFHDRFDLNSLNNLTVPHIVILNEFSRMADPAQIEFRDSIFKSKYPHCTFICCDPIPWSPTPQKAAIVHESQFKMVAPHSHERFLKIIQCACAVRTDLSELKRDLDRYQRLNSPLSMVTLTLNPDEEHQFRGSMRNFDHLVRVGTQTYLYSLANCNKENLSKALLRMEKSINRPIKTSDQDTVTFGQYPKPNPHELPDVLLYFGRQLARSETTSDAVQTERKSA